MDELTRVAQGGMGEITPVNLGDYKIARDEFGNGEATLSDPMIEKHMRQLRDQRYLELAFPPGHLCCPAVFAFSNMGMPLELEDIHNAEHITALLIDPRSGQTMNGFGSLPSYAFNILPEEIRALAFTIPNYDGNSREVFLDRYRAALIKLKEILG